MCPGVAGGVAGSALLSSINAKVNGSQNVKGEALFSAMATLTELAILITGVALPAIHFVGAMVENFLDENQIFEALMGALVGSAFLLATSLVLIPTAIIGGFITGKTAAWATGNNVSMSEAMRPLRNGTQFVVYMAIFALLTSDAASA